MQHPQESKGFSKKCKIITAVAVTVAVLIAVFVPVGLYLAGHFKKESDTVATSAESDTMTPIVDSFYENCPEQLQALKQNPEVLNTFEKYLKMMKKIDPQKFKDSKEAAEKDEKDPEQLEKVIKKLKEVEKNPEKLEKIEELAEMLEENPEMLDKLMQEKYQE